MSRVTLGCIIVVVGLSMLNGRDASACKLCVKFPSTEHVIEVPPHPVIVTAPFTPDIYKDDLIRTFTGYQHGKRIPDKRLRYTVKKVDSDWALVTVDAKVGDQFFVASPVGASCPGVTYRVVAHPKYAADEHAFTQATSYTLGDDVRVWELDWTSENHTTWSRSEWAPDLSTLERGQGKVMSQAEVQYLDMLEPPDVTSMFVRVTHYHVDGTTSVIRLKLTRTGDTVAITELPDRA